MDVFIDLAQGADDRSFSAICDLNADFLGRYAKKEKDLKVTYLALDSILEKREIKQKLIKSNVEVINIPDAEVKSILAHYDATVEMVANGNISAKLKEHLVEFFRKKIGNLNPDIVVYWEYCSDIFFDVLNNSIFLEGHHTGFWRLENKNPDILFNISTKDKKYEDTFFKSLSEMEVSSKDIEDIQNIKKYFQENIAFDTQLNRSILDPENKFKYLIFYPSNVPSLRFKRHSGFASNSAFLQFLLEKIPEDCAIVYSKHPLDKTDSEYFVEQNERIINLNSISSADHDVSIRVLPYVDAVVNVYSNFFMPAMLLGKPIFSYGNSPKNHFAIDDIEHIYDFLSSNTSLPSDYIDISNRIIKYVLTHKVDIRFLRNEKNSYLYLKRIVNNIKTKENDYISYLPQLGTLRGYKARVSQQLLLQNNIFINYEQTGFERILGHLINDNIENIGFDIFDTLLCRPLVKPTDLFHLIEEDVYNITGLRSFNFSRARIHAESFARHGKVEVSLDDIYSTLKENTGFSKDIIDKLKKLECDMERQLLSPRETMLEYFSLAKIHNKNVFIASDMYLPETFLKDILVMNGYNIDNTPVYISCEYNKVKHNGSLFKFILWKEGYSPSKTLFIGDNLKSDVQRAIDNGLLAEHYPKAIEKLQKTNLFRLDVLGFIYKENFSFYLGMIANKVFDNPFIPFDYKTSINNSSALLGYYIFGPLVLSLTHWLVQNTNNSDLKKILFSSRDSRVIYDVYNDINEKIYNNNLPKGVYFYISRTATLSAYTNKALRGTLISLYGSKLDVKKYLEYVFKIDVSNNDVAKKLASELKLNLSADISKNKEKVARFIDSYYEATECENILEQKNKCLIEYISNITDNERFAIFDLGARGTSRDILSDLLGVDIPLYMFRSKPYKCMNNYFSYLVDTCNPFRRGVRVIHPSFYEVLLSDALTSTCYGYEKLGGIVEPIVKTSELTTTSFLTLKAQVYMKEFCRDYISLFKDKWVYINAQTQDSFVSPVAYLCSNTTDTHLLNQYVGDDPLFTDKHFPVIYPPLNKTVNKPVNKVISPKEQSESISGYTSKVNKTNNNIKRDVFIYFKRKFYKNEITKSIWDKGRELYVTYVTKH
ncbi:TPA: capsule biosynthesis protein CapA [Escherichia coli]|uniref:capsule biosynthesis protein CapA n=2 Tax=Escherichia coli TaxID=562 RepID=UPI00200B6BD4|nr:capsule biosynthesis protein CapA [Escherichia coli]